LGDFSDEDEEEGESLGRKMARLRRELEEVKEEYGRRRQEKDRQDALVGEDEEDEAIELSKILDSISTEEGGAGTDSGNRLMKALGTSQRIQKSAVPSEAVHTNGSTTYTVTYAPGYEQSHTLAKAADIKSTVTPALDSKGIPLAILPSLDILQRQVQVLSSSTPSSLDSISRRVRTLTQEAERLDETRKAAKVSQDDLRAAGEDVPKGADGNSMDDPEQISKINALYGTLSTIESLAPLLPALLDRLRSLRMIHSEAATAHEGIERAMAKQESMATDIKRWRDGLEKVEGAVKNSEVTMGNNVVALEGWVKDLEKRMEKLGLS
jgi:nuclear migration protein JNM1